MLKVLGVDPGASGAIALYTRNVGLIIRDMPVGVVTRSRRQHQLSEPLLGTIIRDLKPEWAFIEDVHAMPKQGVSSSFKFGLDVGIVRGALGALEIPFEPVTPQEWKKAYKLNADKEQARLLAIRLFPHAANQFSLKKHHGRAEAALLALFGWWKLSGEKGDVRAFSRLTCASSAP